VAKRRKRRNFTDEYKAEVVQLVEASDKPLAQVAHDLDLTVSVVRGWVAKSRANAKPQSQVAKLDSEAEIKTLRKRVKILEMEREILKKATAFFVKENS
jgi:transposase